MEQNKMIAEGCNSGEGCGLPVINPDTGLTASQEECALLLASGISITDAARQINTSRTTIYRWLGNKAFRCYFNSVKQDAKNFIEGTLIDMKSKALDSIRKCMDSDNEMIKFRAAMWVLDKIEQIPIDEVEIRTALRKTCAKLPTWDSGAAYRNLLEQYGITDDENTDENDINDCDEDD